MSRDERWCMDQTGHGMKSVYGRLESRDRAVHTSPYQSIPGVGQAMRERWE
ncbi:hypothetical protein AALB64_16455 [Lachnospiraceae bacterium 45-P1]